MRDSIKLTSKRKPFVELKNPLRKKRRGSISSTESYDSNTENDDDKNLTLKNPNNESHQPFNVSNEANKNIEREIEKVDKNKLISLFTDCMTALSTNKICSYNAFDIGIIDHIDDLVTLKNEEVQQEDNTNDVCFSTASKVVEGASKVYGYRVEAVYDKTFNVLMNIQNSEKEQKKAKGINKKKIYEFTGMNTLLSENEVTLNELPSESLLMDPFFLKISSLFDQSGPQGLLLVNILINYNLQLSLSSSISNDNTNEEDKLNKEKNKDNKENRRLKDTNDVNLYRLEDDKDDHEHQDDMNNTNNDETNNNTDGMNNICSLNDDKDFYNGRDCSYTALKTNLNRKLLGKLAFNYNSLNILPELDAYINQNKDILAISNYEYSQYNSSVNQLNALTNFDDNRSSNEILSLTDNPEQNVDGLNDTGNNNNNYNNNNNNLDLDFGSNNNTQSELYMMEDDNVDYYDVYEREEDLNSNLNDLNNLSTNLNNLNRTDSNKDYQYMNIDNLDLLNRINIMNTNNQLSYYTSEMVNDKVKKIENKLEDKKKNKESKENKSNNIIRIKNLEDFVFNFDLNEELDSIELLPSYTENINLNNINSNLNTNLSNLNIDGNNFVNMNYRIDINELLNSYNIYLNLSNTGSNQFNTLINMNSNIMSNNYSMDDYNEGFMEFSNDSYEQLNEQADEAELDNFIDILKLKNYILDYLNSNTNNNTDGVNNTCSLNGNKDYNTSNESKETDKTDGNHSDMNDTNNDESNNNLDSQLGNDSIDYSNSVKFNDLVNYIYRKFNKKVVSIHILFVCLLHVCNESNLLLFNNNTLYQTNKGLVTNNNNMDENLFNNTNDNDFYIKFDSIKF